MGAKAERAYLKHAKPEERLKLAQYEAQILRLQEEKRAIMTRLHSRRGNRIRKAKKNGTPFLEC